MSALLITILVLAWALFALWARRVSLNPRGDVVSGMAWDLVIVYTRLFHGLRVDGRENIPAKPVVEGRPVIIIANHSAGVDPVLIQSVVPFFIRWMMAADMRSPALEGLWSFLEVICVDRSGKADVAALRTAMRVAGTHEALGVFPEGRLRRTPRQLNTFQPGVALLASRTNALLLPVVITGTPMCKESWSSLIIPSRSRLRFLPLLDPKTLGKTSEVPGALEALFTRWLTEAGNPPDGTHADAHVLTPS
jgi:1-acyl-sn-glycerol-3-phosphate acyltransferase